MLVVSKTFVRLLFLLFADVHRFAIVLVLPFAQDGVLGVTGERLARGVELTGLKLALHSAGRPELQATVGGIGAQLVNTLVVVATLPLRNVYDVEDAERVDGNARPLALGELAADLVEHGREHGFYRGLTDAAALDDGSCELFEVLLRQHILN